MKKIPNWYDLIPYGTKEGDEENAFFISLARNPKYIWRSTSGLAKDSNLSKERTEQIIQKYMKLNMIFNNPKNEDNWGYWERVPKDMLPKKIQSIIEKDQKQRVKDKTK